MVTIDGMRCWIVVQEEGTQGLDDNLYTLDPNAISFNLSFA